MDYLPGTHLENVGILSLRRAGGRTGYDCWRAAALRAWFLAAAVLLAVPLVFAQANPRVTAIDPASGKVDDSVTVTGENLDKNSVAAAFLSDANSDYKATVVEQAPEKIVIKIPQVKSGDYNISIQVGNSILIQPVRFKVE